MERSALQRSEAAVRGVRRFAALLIVLTIGLALSGCSSKPADQEVQDAVVSQFDPALFVVANFQKTNGFQPDDRTYLAEYQYDLIFKRSLKDLVTTARDDKTADPLRQFGAGIEILALAVKYGDFEAGHAIRMEGTKRFIKTEQGWLAVED